MTLASLRQVLGHAAERCRRILAINAINAINAIKPIALMTRSPGQP